ncbi:MAG: hypothetical protein HDP34_02875 [Clostridia bacterium]|nr:hypothetical protein [Clostridia bacterium]
MAKGISYKKIKIKPENEAKAEGFIQDLKYAGSSSVGIGPFKSVKMTFKAYVSVDGVEKPLVAVIYDKMGWNVGILSDIQVATNEVLQKLPFDLGDKVVVTYDRIKPKKCNIVIE